MREGDSVEMKGKSEARESFHLKLCELCYQLPNDGSLQRRPKKVLTMAISGECGNFLEEMATF
jgi:hypothetical protein